MKGMIMGAENVRAILDGRKTRHSFLIKPQPQEHSEVEVGMWHPTGIDKQGMAYPKPAVWGVSFESYGFGAIGVCPRYKVGEIVYVKETFANIMGGPPFGFTVYRADRETLTVETQHGVAEETPNWKSPLFMKESASRIHLEITGIKAQRLQDITEEEALAEGIEVGSHGIYESIEAYERGEKPIEDCVAYRDYSIKEEDNEGFNHCHYPILSYRTLWDSLNAKKGFPWEASPWVFAYTFKVVEG